MTPTDGGPWRGPSTEEWVERIARLSTPAREYADDGSFRPWIQPFSAPSEPTAIAPTPHAGAVKPVGSLGVPRGRQPVTAGE